MKLRLPSEFLYQVFYVLYAVSLEHIESSVSVFLKVITDETSSPSVSNLTRSSCSHKWIKNQITFLSGLKQGNGHNVLWKWGWMFVVSCEVCL